MSRRGCFVPGCDADAPHERTFSIAAPNWGEVETTVSVCCEHVDALTSDRLDVTVVGVPRG